MLKLPCFLVDWKLPSPSTELGEFHCEFVHRTDSVYILRNDEEIFSWDEGKFNRAVDSLHQGQSNNRLVNGDARLLFKGPGIHGKVQVIDKSNTVLLEANGLFGNNRVSALLNRHYSHSKEFWTN
jgi:hypothetical protein